MPCVFCAVVAGDAPAIRIYEDDDYLAILDIRPVVRAARASELKADGNNIAINDGKAAFQSVLHIHLHVAPRQLGDKLSFAKGLVVRRDPDREATGRILRDALAKLDAVKD